MNKQICQSCGMPLTNNTFGTNSESSFNTEYCKFCFKDGKFTKPDLTLEDQIRKLTKMAVEKFNVSETEALQMAESTLPSLKRWQKTN